MSPRVKLGASYAVNGLCRFLVWAPLAGKVDVHIVAPAERVLHLRRDGRGYHRALVDDVSPGTLYFYRLDDQEEYPDAASRFQPHGVHGPSQVMEPAFDWEDGDWAGQSLQDYIIYEAHVGTATSEGTLEALIPVLDTLKETGITALELMPVAQFPGSRNWGYDGVHPFAVHDSYGGPVGLKRLVNACHRKGLAVILDVVYNHIGPEGNYFSKFAPYFTDRYCTPWGPALNFDGPFSDDVRRFFIENAEYWLSDFHLDALRLDALHAILDFSPRTFLEDMVASVGRLGRRLNRRMYLIGESDSNDRRLVRSPDLGGYGLDAQWNDDFHHALHTLLTGERAGYYRDFGGLNRLVKGFREGFIYSGEYSAYRRRRHGSSSRDLAADRFIVFAQNHDQVGNRMLGNRLSQLVSLDALKLAAGVVLLSPFIPLLFMGEEYGETAPFLYFTSHSDPGLIEAVRKGRREEFAGFKWEGQPPDPQDTSTFLCSKLDHHLRLEGWHCVLAKFYKRLITIRKTNPVLSYLSKETLEVTAHEESGLLYVRRWDPDAQAVAAFNFGDVRSPVLLPIPRGRWHKQMDSAESQWLGKGSSVPADLDSNGNMALEVEPKSFVLFAHRREE